MGAGGSLHPSSQELVALRSHCALLEAEIERLRAIINLGRKVCGKGTMNCIGAKLVKDAIEDLD